MFYIISFNIFDIMKHSDIPIIVGINIETIVHFILFVSFFIVSRVVPQGKWHIVKIINDMAVIIVHPCAFKSEFSSEAEL